MKKTVFTMNRRVLFLMLFPILFFAHFASAQSGFILEDSIVTKLNKCGGKADICIKSLTAAQVASAKITVNGKAYTDPILPCSTDTILAYDFSNFGAATPAPYTLDSVRINGKLFTGKNIPTLKALADSLSKWDNTADWVYNDVTKKMVGGKTTSKYTAMSISTTTIVSTSNVGLNTGFEAKGAKFAFDEGAYKVVVNLPSLNQKDSIYLYVVCPKKEITSKTIKVGKTEKFCIGKKDLPAGKILSLKNFNPVAANGPISVKFLAGDSCVDISALKKGKDTLFLVAFGQNNIQDTTILYIDVEASTAVLGNKKVNVDVYEGKTKKYCVATDALINGTTDSIKSVTNLCPTKSGKDVKFTFKNGDPCVTLEGLKAGGIDTACIVVCNNKGKCDTTTIYGRVVKDCKSLVKLDSVVSYVADCSLKGQICFPDFKPADSLKYSFYADGNIYLDDKVGCAFDTIIAYNYSIMLVNGKFLPPPFTVDSWTINGKKFTGDFTDIKDLVDKMNVWDPKGKWVLDPVKQLIIGGLPSQKYSPIKITNQTFLVESELGFNIGLNARGLALSFEKGVHQIVVIENATGCADTIKAFVSCIKTDIYSQEVELGKSDTLCFDISQLFSDPVSTVNTSNDAKNPNVTFSVTGDKKCIYYKGNKLGLDTAIVVSCDKYKFCDTSIIYVNVVKQKKPPSGIIVIKDTILVGNTGKYCIDTAKYLNGKKFKDFKAVTKNNFAEYTLDNKTFCLNYKGLKAIGTDTSTIYFCSDVKCDTFKLYVTVKPAPLPKDVVLDTIPLGSTYTFCLPASKFTGVDLTKTPLEVTNTCPKTNSPVTFTVQQSSECAAPNGFGYAVVYKGTKIGKDTACVEVKDKDGKKATLKVVVYVVPRTPYIVKDTIVVKEQQIYCLETDKLDLTGKLDSVFNFCPKKVLSPVNFAILKAGNCKSGFGVIYSGLSAGKDTACIAVKDKYGNIDTAFFYITVIKPIGQKKIIYDTLYVFQTNSTCVDTVALGINGLDKIDNICKSKGGEKVVFTLNPTGKCTTANGTPGLTITWTGAEVGTDTACWLITDKKGKKDTIKTIVTVLKPKPSILKDQVEEGGMITLCPDKKQIDAKIDSIYNACPKNKNDNITYVLDKKTNCVKITGVKIGIDTLCIVVIDQFGTPDTTTMLITVVKKGSISIVAVDDNATGPKNKDINIKLIQNDKLSDTTAIKIVIIPKANGGKGPNHGSVLSVDQKTGVAKYMPAFDYCGKDTFTYQICIGNKCDTADVFIDIKCDTSDNGTLVIYSGFSPNEDNLNDFFTIKGIQNPLLKGNVLAIYNRWGNEVYRKTDYDNTWDGTWNGHKLADGTYWYILCLPDKSTKSGFLEIRR
jgi:gliding motility-associated-like protein